MAPYSVAVVQPPLSYLVAIQTAAKIQAATIRQFSCSDLASLGYQHKIE